ncbi:unnamed protein product [Zymoseptoria tritici ST99CH_3D1]|nr:unnamed protein product [Zymoseptoria tritici ST99CH_3D1]
MNVTELTQPLSDVVSAARFSPDGQTLLVSSWDTDIYVYNRDDNGAFAFSRKICSTAPVLDLAWNANGTTFYAVGLAQQVLQYQLDGDNIPHTVLSVHDSGACRVRYSAKHNVVISIAWDETMHIHNLENGGVSRMALSGKPVALALNDDYAVVTLVNRKVYVHDLATLKNQCTQTFAQQQQEEEKPVAGEGPVQLRESSLKFLTRDVACMPDGKGFVCSSIEGRVGVEWFDKEDNKQMYAFKCHREKTTTVNEKGESVPLDVVFPVNAVAFHPVHKGSFATGGGDGVVALWDANTKRRIKQYQKLPGSVACLEFSADGRYLAIGVSPGFEDGKEQNEPDQSLIKVVIRELGESEAKGKAAKEKS